MLNLYSRLNATLEDIFEWWVIVLTDRSDLVQHNRIQPLTIHGKPVRFQALLQRVERTFCTIMFY